MVNLIGPEHLCRPACWRWPNEQLTRRWWGPRYTNGCQIVRIAFGMPPTEVDWIRALGSLVLWFFGSFEGTWQGILICWLQSNCSRKGSRMRQWRQCIKPANMLLPGMSWHWLHWNKTSNYNLHYKTLKMTSSRRHQNLAYKNLIYIYKTFRINAV